MKYFIITVDTEGDNGWGYHDGDKVKTENTLWIPRFQELCDKYGMKPVYLTNYEMICDDRFVSYIKPKVEKGLCEVGIHIHAWNNPPMYNLDRKYSGNAYLIEYPREIMHEKFAVTYNLIKERIGVAPVTHRAGRWVMNDDYFQLLEEFGIKIDCSMTPGISWGTTPGTTIAGGSDYSAIENKAFKKGNILEVPVTIQKLHIGDGGLKQRIRYLILGKNIWLRPALSSLRDMIRIIDCSNNSNYVEFMIHSSELMPGGSPYFKEESDIERLFDTMESLFIYAKEKGYITKTLGQYYDECHLRQNLIYKKYTSQR